MHEWYRFSSPSARSPLHWESSVQNERGRLLQFLFAAVEVGVQTDCCWLHILLCRLHKWASLQSVQLFGQDRSLRLLQIPALSCCTCGYWVACGLCLVSWPQPAATDGKSGTRPSRCVAPGLLWWRSSFLGRWHCCLAVFLWLQVWRARPLFHFLETTVGWYPLQEYSSVLPDFVKRSNSRVSK